MGMNSAPRAFTPFRMSFQFLYNFFYIILLPHHSNHDELFPFPNHPIHIPLIVLQRLFIKSNELCSIISLLKRPYILCKFIIVHAKFLVEPSLTDQEFSPSEQRSSVHEGSQSEECHPSQSWICPHLLWYSFSFSVSAGCNAMMNFAVPILGCNTHFPLCVGNLASVCMAIVNYVNAFSNFLVPSVISLFGSPQRALFWCCISYMYLQSNCVPVVFTFPNSPMSCLSWHTQFARYTVSFLPSCGLPKALFSAKTRMTTTVAENPASSWLFTCLEVYEWNQ